MKNKLFLLIVLLTVACEKPKPNSIAEHNPLHSSEKVLVKVNYTNALHRYGSPQKEEKIKLTTAPKHIQDAATSFTPNADSTKVLHVQWKKLAEQTINVWYIFKENQWKPLFVGV